MALAPLSVKIGADTTGFEKGLRRVQKGAIGLKNVLGKLGLVAGGVGLAALGKQAIGLASDLTEVQNVVDVTFGNMSAYIDNFAKSCKESFGMSELSAKQFASSMGAAIKSAGLMQRETALMSTTLTALTGDMASFYNKTAEAVNADLFSGIISNQIETLRKYGIELSVVNLEAFAMSRGITKAYDEMSSAEKIALRYNYVLSVTKDAQGDFARTSGTWANQTRLLTENFKSLMTVLGNNLISVLTPVVQVLNKVVKKLTEAFLGVQKLFGALGGKNVSSDINKQAAPEDAFASSVEQGTDAIKEQEKAIKRTAASFDKFNDITPTESKSSSSGASGAGNSIPLDDPYKIKFEEAEPLDTSWVDELIPKFSSVAGTIKTTFRGVWEGIQHGLSSINFESISKNLSIAFSGLKEIASNGMNKMLPVIKSGADLLGEALKWGITIGGQGFDIVSEAAAKFISDNKQSIMEWQDDITSSLSTGLKNIKSSISILGSTLSESLENGKVKISDTLAGFATSFSMAAQTIGAVFADTFQVATGNIASFCENNQNSLKSFWDNAINLFTQSGGLLNSVAQGFLSVLQSNWDKHFKGVVDGVWKFVMDVAGWLIRLYNEFLYPIVSKMLDWFQKIWDENLKGAADNFMGFVGRIQGMLLGLYQNVLKPIIDWWMDNVLPIIKTTIGTIVDIVMGLVNTIVGVVKNIFRALNGLLDFITGIFTGDWEKAWNGIKEYFAGVWDGFWTVVKGVVNLIIGALNLVWENVYVLVKGIVDSIGGIAGALGDLFGQDWHFSMPKTPPTIPYLAKGGVAYGEVAAVVGDNFNARQDPEVISPLSTLKNMIVEALVQKDISSGGSEINIKMTLDSGEVLADMMIDPMNNTAKNKGYAPVFRPAT
jgi:hypothetical protein